MNVRVACESVQSAACGRHRRVYPPVVVETLKRRSLCLHVQCVVKLIVNAQLPVDFRGTFAMVPREESVFIFIDGCYMVLLDRVGRHPHIVRYQLGLCQQV